MGGGRFGDKAMGNYCFVITEFLVFVFVLLAYVPFVFAWRSHKSGSLNENYCNVDYYSNSDT